MAPYLAEGSTFKVHIEAFGWTFTDSERLKQIQRLGQMVTFKGKVKLSGADHTSRRDDEHGEGDGGSQDAER